MVSDYSAEAGNWWGDAIASVVSPQQAQEFGGNVSSRIAAKVETNSILIKPDSPVIAESAIEADIESFASLFAGTKEGKEFEHMLINERGIRVIQENGVKSI